MLTGLRAMQGVLTRAPVQAGQQGVAKHDLHPKSWEGLIKEGADEWIRPEAVVCDVTSALLPVSGSSGMCTQH